MNTVIFAEKPSQAKAYADAFTVKSRQKTHIELNPCSTFTSGAIITWGIGHLVELKEPKEYKKEWAKWDLASLPILLDHYQFKVSSDKRAQFNFIKQLFNRSDVSTIINGCDVDREGSNIFYSIFNMTGAKDKTIKRLWINSLEADEIQRGFNSLQDNKKDLLLYEEARARQISDWIVGMNGSRLYTLLLQQKGFSDSLSIGRVQSPTVFLIYQRQLEIDNFKSEPFFEVEAMFTAENGTYKGKAKAKEAKKELLIELLRKHNLSTRTPGIVTSVKTKDKRTPPPLLHALSTLQATANRLWKTSPANVLKTVQNLYEKKLVTYPRTDSRHITQNEFSYLARQVESYQNLIGKPFSVTSLSPKKRYVDGSKVQEHHAIIPTKKIPSESVVNKLSSLERNIYEEIIRTTLAMFHTDYLYTETKITTEVNDLPFFTTGKTERDKGWKDLFTRTTKKNDKDAITLPLIHEQEKVQSKIEITEGKTKPPKPYTEGQLIAMMKTCGKLVDNKEETTILKEVEGLGTEATRSGIIETIKRHNYIKVTKNIVSITDKGRLLCQAIDGNLLSSPSMTAKWESYLRKIGNGEGTEVKFLNNISKFIQSLLDDVPGQLDSHKIDPTLITASSGRTRKSAICLCPTCKKGQIIAHKGFYGCTEYRNGCKQTFPTIFLKKKLTPNQIKSLCVNGSTNMIKGFVSKQDKKFNAKLSLDKGKLKFDF